MVTNFLPILTVKHLWKSVIFDKVMKKCAKFSATLYVGLQRLWI